MRMRIFRRRRPRSGCWKSLIWLMRDGGDHLVAETMFPRFEFCHLRRGKTFGKRQVKRERQLGGFVAGGTQVVNFEFAQVERRAHRFFFFCRLCRFGGGRIGGCRRGLALGLGNRSE